MKVAYRKKYPFVNNSEEYRLFLKENLFNLKPEYYALKQKVNIITLDGPMIAVSMTKNNIEDPNSTIIAKCWINNEHIILLDNHCWGVAIDKHGINCNHYVNDNNCYVTLLFQIGGEINASDS